MVPLIFATSIASTWRCGLSAAGVCVLHLYGFSASRTAHSMHVVAIFPHV